MIIKSEKNGENLTVALDGKLDAVTAVEFDQFLENNLGGIKNLTIDLKNLDYIASAGLRVLLKTQKKMNLQGEMLIKNIQREVRTVMNMTGFSKLLTIEE